MHERTPEPMRTENRGVSMRMDLKTNKTHIQEKDFVSVRMPQRIDYLAPLLEASSNWPFVGCVRVIPV